MKIILNSWWKNKTTGHKAMLEGSEFHGKVLYLTPINGAAEEMEQIKTSPKALKKFWALV